MSTTQPVLHMDGDKKLIAIIKSCFEADINGFSKIAIAKTNLLCFLFYDHIHWLQVKITKLHSYFKLLTSKTVVLATGIPLSLW